MARSEPYGSFNFLVCIGQGDNQAFAGFSEVSGLDSDVPVAEMLALCEDESVIGRAFYLMEFVQGQVFWEQSLPGMSKQQRRAHYVELNRVLSRLHLAPYAQIGLQDYGKPGNYIERQIARWSKQYQASITQPIEAMDRLIEWLPAHLPANDETVLVHGDFRLDNMVFHPTEPRVLGVMLGVWFLASAAGNKLAGYFGGFFVADDPTRLMTLYGAIAAGMLTASASV